MAFLPRTAISLFGFIVFAGWLIAQIFDETTSIQQETESLTNSQTQIVEATKNIGTGGIFGSLTAVFQIIWNVLVLIFDLFATVFSSVAGFLNVVVGLPAIISQIFIVILLLGVIFVLVKVFIPDA